jgi:GNAT superfamily N-acetyltransferase
MEDEAQYRANIENLAAFWTACGVTDLRLPSGAALHRSDAWPHRLWLDYGTVPDRADCEQIRREAEQAAAAHGELIPQWREDDDVLAEVLQSSGFAVRMTQQAMAAPMDAFADLPPCSLELRTVSTMAEADDWARVGTEAFGYVIDEPVIERLTGQAGLHMVLAMSDDAIVGTGMMMVTGGTAGLHMLGVPRAHRRRGHARQIMHGLLGMARDLGCSLTTLQASAEGGPLYRHLGYDPQGTIRSYGPVVD